MSIGIGDKVYVKNHQKHGFSHPWGRCRGFILKKGSSMAMVPGYGIGPKPGSKVTMLIVSKPDPQYAHKGLTLGSAELPLSEVTNWENRPIGVE